MSGLFEKAFWQAVDDADAGESKPLDAYLTLVPSDQQDQLRTLLAKVFAAQGPGTRPTPAETESYARALDVIERVRSETGPSGTLPGLLVQIRHSRGIERDHVIDRLTQRFSLGHDAVRRAYHRLESGQLIGSLLSRRLLVALGEVFEIDVGDLEAASEPTGPPPAAQRAMAFGRPSDPQGQVSMAHRGDVETATDHEVRALFTGGRDA